MSKEDNNQSRGKLTLKLKVSASSSEQQMVNAAANTVSKNTESKRVSNSLVQVTIKGRKKEIKLGETDRNHYSHSKTIPEPCLKYSEAVHRSD